MLVTLDRSEVAGYLAVLLACAGWGTSGVFVKFIAADSNISALALAFWRDLSTFTVLLLTLGLLRPAWLRAQRRDLIWLVALGSSLGAFHVFWNLGVLLNGAAVATVQQAAMPAIVTVAAWLLWGEPLTRRKVLAIALTFTGTVLVSGLDVLGRVRLTTPGLLAGLGIPITYASFNLFGKKVSARYRSPTMLVYGFGFGALTLLPLQFFTPQPWPVLSSTWTWFAALIGLSTIIPWSVYTFGLRRLPASVASILAMAEIPIVSVYAYFLLSERLTATQFIGAALVVSGVLLLWRKQSSDTGQRMLDSEDEGGQQDGGKKEKHSQDDADAGARAEGDSLRSAPTRTQAVHSRRGSRGSGDPGGPGDQGDDHPVF